MWPHEHSPCTISQGYHGFKPEPLFLPPASYPPELRLWTLLTVDPPVRDKKFRDSVTATAAEMRNGWPEASLTEELVGVQNRDDRFLALLGCYLCNCFLKSSSSRCWSVDVVASPALWRHSQWASKKRRRHKKQCRRHPRLRLQVHACVLYCQKPSLLFLVLIIGVIAPWPRW